MNRRSPTPWSIQISYGTPTIKSSEGTMCNFEDYPEAMADAILMSAAPEIVASLRLCMAELEPFEHAEGMGPDFTKRVKYALKASRAALVIAGTRLNTST